MSGTIGGLTFFKLSGTLPAPSMKTESVERANVSGFVERELGVRAEVGSLVAEVDVTEGNLKSFEDSVYALEGTFVSVTLGTGQAYTGVFVKRAYCHPPRFMGVMQGGLNVAEGASGYYVTAQVEARRTS